MMKKVSIIIAFMVCRLAVMADEGMWLPMLLGQQVYNDMVKRGLKVSKEQLYSIVISSVAGAVPMKKSWKRRR